MYVNIRVRFHSTNELSLGTTSNAFYHYEIRKQIALYELV